MSALVGVVRLARWRIELELVEGATAPVLHPYTRRQPELLTVLHRPDTVCHSSFQIDGTVSGPVQLQYGRPAITYGNGAQP